VAVSWNTSINGYAVYLYLYLFAVDLTICKCFNVIVLRAAVSVSFRSLAVQLSSYDNLTISLQRFYSVTLLTLLCEHL